MHRCLWVLFLLSLAPLYTWAADAGSLSISIASPQIISGNDPNEPDAPRQLDYTALQIVLRNTSGRPIRLWLSDNAAGYRCLSFILILDNGQQITIQRKEITNWFTNSLREWLLQPEEMLVRNEKIYDAQWEWIPRKAYGHKGVLIPVYNQVAFDGESGDWWVGSIKGRGINVQLPGSISW